MRPCSCASARWPPNSNSWYTGSSNRLPGEQGWSLVQPQQQKRVSSLYYILLAMNARCQQQLLQVSNVVGNCSWIVWPTQSGWCIRVVPIVLPRKATHSSGAGVMLELVVVTSNQLTDPVNCNSSWSQQKTMCMCQGARSGSKSCPCRAHHQHQQQQFWNQPLYVSSSAVQSCS
jgi:hypothetical protein